MAGSDDGPQGGEIVGDDGWWVIAGAVALRRLYLHNIRLIGSSMNTRGHFAMLVEAARRGTVRPADPLVIHRWTNRLHLLRNRIAHVEPLIATDVMSYHRSAARLLRAIDPAMSDWYAGISRIPELCKRRP